MSVYIIAEAGVNHNGNLEMAYQLVDEAKKAGADCVKFQTFRSENLVAPFASMAAYQKQNIQTEDTQLQMLRKLELSYENFRALKTHCEKVGIVFLSTPFDLDSLRFLDELGVPFWKIPSGEITNLPYLEAIGRTGRPVVMSTGMAGIEDVRMAVNALKASGSCDIILLHCNTEYPTPFEDVNLRAMDTLHQTFGVPVGFSDHTQGVEAVVAAVAMGAKVVEKHFTLDKTLPGPDHKASLDPQELAMMVRMIRHVEQALGTGEKKPTPSERKNMEVARKSIVAATYIAKGQIIKEEMLAAKRPGTGISPMRWYEIIGTPAMRDFNENEMIEL